MQNETLGYKIWETLWSAFQAENDVTFVAVWVWGFLFEMFRIDSYQPDASGSDW